MDEGIRTSQRVSRSCVECGRRKIKCDKKIPCKPCVRRNLAHECQRPITRVRGQLTVAGVNDGLSEGEDKTVDELLKERCALQAQIAELETALALSKPCAHSHVGKPDAQTLPEASLEDIVPALEQFDLGVASDSHAANISEKDVADRLYEPATDPLFLLLPSRETSDFLITYSLRTLGWLHCAINAPTFLGEHREFWDKVQIGVRIEASHRPWLAVYFALLATGLLYLDPDELPAIADLPQLGLVEHHSDAALAVHNSRIWYEVALKEVERCGCSGAASIHIVQALSVLTLCHSNFGEHQREWLLTGFAANMARCLDMHRLGSELAHSKSLLSRPEWATAEQRELGRRLWWTYVIRDWLGSWSRPPSISPASFCCQFTTDNTINHNVILEPPGNPASPSPLLYQTIMSRLAYIFYIYIKVNTHHTASKYTKAMEEIETVKRNLPLHLSSKFPANIDDEEWESEHPWIPFQRYLLTHALDFMQLTIARTLAIGNIGTESKSYRLTAMTSATNILQSYLSPVLRVYKLVWIVSASTVAAAIFISLDLLLNPHEYSPARKRELIDCLRQVSWELNRYSSVAIHASKGSSFIQRLLSRLNQEEPVSNLSVQEILHHLVNQVPPSSTQNSNINDSNIFAVDAIHHQAGPEAWEQIWGGDSSMLHIDENNSLEAWDMDFPFHLF